MIGWSGEEKGESGPVRGQGKEGAERQKRCLDKDRVFGIQCDDIPKDLGIGLDYLSQRNRVRGGVIWHE
jgi:hypothetical protein